MDWTYVIKDGSSVYGLDLCDLERVKTVYGLDLCDLEQVKTVYGLDLSNLKRVNGLWTGPT